MKHGFIPQLLLTEPLEIHYTLHLLYYFYYCTYARRTIDSKVKHNLTRVIYKHVSMTESRSLCGKSRDFNPHVHSFVE